MTKNQITVCSIILSIIAMFVVEKGYTQSPLYDILGGKKKITIPFEYKFNFIVVDLKLNNKIPLKFIFDTGATHTVLFERLYVQLLGLQYQDSLKILGSDMSKELNAHIYRKVGLHFKNKINATRDIIVLDRDQIYLKNFLGMHLDGIIGANLFRNFVVKIDYDNRQIEIINPEYFKIPSQKYKKVDIEFINNKPYFSLPLSLSKDTIIKAKLLMDTGAGINAILYNRSHKKIRLPSHHIMGTLGTGMGGVIQGYRARIHNIEMAEFDFIQPVVHFQDIDSSYVFQQIAKNEINGIIGNKLLSQFTIIIDWWNNCVYLKPRRGANKSFKYDKSGLYLYAVGEKLNQFLVQQVIEKSPAAKAGIQSGDIILSINFLPAQLFNLEEFSARFQKKAGKKIRLKISRNGIKMVKIFRLEDLL